MAKRAGAYKSEKRRKELSRQRKQEKKRQRRFDKKVNAQQDTEMIDSEGKDSEQES